MYLVYELMREYAGFDRLGLTRLGHVHKDIEQVIALKTPDKRRYLVIEVSNRLDPGIMEKIAGRLAMLGLFIQVSDIIDVDNIKQQAQSHAEGYKYKLYFDRPTYVR